MPIKYAVRTRLDVPLTEQEQYMVDTQGWKIPEDKFSYEEVPAIVAEMDEESGVYAVFSENGKKLSQWLLVKQPEAVQKHWKTGRAKPGPTLKDSIGQDINQGDYLAAYRQKETSLELCHVVRNLQTRTAVENLSSSRFTSTEKSINNRHPDTFIKLPIELIEGGAATPVQLEKQFSLREAEHIPYQGIKEDYTLVDETTAMTAENGYFGYFNRGELISGWIPSAINSALNKKLVSDTHSKNKLVEELEVPLTDVMGTDILLNDWVFSNYGNATIIMLCKVIGFTKDRVRLLGYLNTSPYLSLEGQRIVTLNPPENIIKLPIVVN